MRVLFVASELYPLVKTGGLADVCGALPLALAQQRFDVRALIPAYPGVLDGLRSPVTRLRMDPLFGGAVRVVAGLTETGAHVFALDAPHLFARKGNPYVGPDGRDWPDNHLRFGALSWMAREIGLGRLGDWRPDIVHAHDWQAGLAPAYLALSRDRRPATVITIHNIAFQGLFPADTLTPLRLPQSAFTPEGVEYHGKVGFLKAGLHYADQITTVSPTYAREIQTPEFGEGLDGLLRHRARQLTGIVNGIDAGKWNPAADGSIAARYTATKPEGKGANKAALQSRLGLQVNAGAPLFCVISRMSAQKGLDLLLANLPTLLAGGGQLAVLGNGDANLETGFRNAMTANPGRIGGVIGYDEPLAHLMQAGADVIVVPSRFEPCGLTQLYGLRYGTLPLVARLGGLADTVIDANEAAMHDGVATGFQFAPVTAEALGNAFTRVFELYARKDAWRQVVHRAMTRKVGWQEPAEKYAALYRSLAPPDAV